MEILYTVPEVAKLLKTNTGYVHKLRKSGKLPFIKIGQYKCRKEALENFLITYEGQDVTDPENVRPI